MIKEVDKLEPADFAAHPVWEFVNTEDTLVRPVENLPVDSLDFRGVGTRIKLRNGSEVWAELSNLDVHDVRKTKQFLVVCVHKDGKRFPLARYFDSWYGTHGPAQLAAFLGLPLDEVFPMSYDVSAVVKGLPEAVRALIHAEPKERLTSGERYALGRVRPGSAL